MDISLQWLLAAVYLAPCAILTALQILEPTTL